MRFWNYEICSWAPGNRLRNRFGLSAPFRSFERNTSYIGGPELALGFGDLFFDLLALSLLPDGRPFLQL